MKSNSSDIIWGGNTPLTMEHSKYYYEYDRNDPNRKNAFMTEEDRIEVNIEKHSI